MHLEICFSPDEKWDKNLTKYKAENILNIPFTALYNIKEIYLVKI